jgi:hypothetical protein
MKTLRGTFDNLVSTMKRYDLYQKDDEVDFELNELSNLIYEVEKRMVCIEKSAEEINEAIGRYTERVDNNETFVMSITDHDSIMRGSHDIEIALDLNDKEVIENNWYGLFEEPKEENVPRETIILIPKGSIVEWVETRKYYNAKGGAKARVIQDYTTEHESDDNYLIVEWLDEKANEQQSGGYERDCFKEEFEQPSVPTFLCHSDDIHSVVKDVISKLKDVQVDGETMQYILKEVGMEKQMLRQLIMNSTETDTKDLLEEKRILSNQGKLV